jgi:hypothetical protein
MTIYLRALTEVHHGPLYNLLVDHTTIWIRYYLFNFVSDPSVLVDRSCDSEKRFLLVLRRWFAMSHVVKV